MSVFVVPSSWGEHWGPVAGVHIGHCVAGSEFPRMQAAHYHPSGGAFPSWICVRHSFQIYYRDSDSESGIGNTDRPSVDMLHELAHVLTGRSHNDRMSSDEYIWADTMLELLSMEGINPVRAGDQQLLQVLRRRKGAILRRRINGR